MGHYPVHPLHNYPVHPLHNYPIHPLHNHRASVVWKEHELQSAVPRRRSQIFERRLPVSRGHRHSVAVHFVHVPKQQAETVVAQVSAVALAEAEENDLLGVVILVGAHETLRLDAGIHPARAFRHAQAQELLLVERSEQGPAADARVRAHRHRQTPLVFGALVRLKGLDAQFHICVLLKK